MGASGTAFGAGTPSADKETIRWVEAFIKTPTADLPPDAVPAFMGVDPAALPARLRKPFRAKKEELLALQRIAEGKRKPPIRRYGMENVACKPDEADGRALEVLRLAGYDEIYEDEVLKLGADTKCSVCELELEFTLKEVSWKDPSKKRAKPRPRYFLHVKDPLWTLVGSYRAGRSPFGTAFFGVGRPGFCH